MRHLIACVGVIVLIGCTTLIVAPNFAPDPAESLRRAYRPTIIIDAGHGGMDGGGKGKELLEKELTLQLAHTLQQRLVFAGFPTVMTRTDDRYVHLQERVNVANRQEGACLFISLHFNKGFSSAYHGIETFYTNRKLPVQRGWRWVGYFNADDPLDTGEELAAYVQGGMISATGARDRGIRERDLFVVRNTWAPAILIEGGFMSNSMESALLKNEAYIERLAKGIAEGIEQWCTAQSREKKRPEPLAELRDLR